MKKLLNVTVVGDTTTGAGANDYTEENIQGEFKLACGFTIRVSTVYVTRYDGLPIEWNGVLPDIRIPQTAENIKNGIDNPVEQVSCFGLLKIGEEYVCGPHNLWFTHQFQEVIPFLLESSEGTYGCLCYLAALVTRELTQESYI